MQHEPKSKLTEAKIVKNAHSNKGLIVPSLTNVHVGSHTGKMHRAVLVLYLLYGYHFRQN